jgi:hypothetical protein
MQTMTKLLLVDCDGTIRKPITRNLFIQHPRDQKIIKGAAEAIAHFHAQGYTIIGITNQGGVAMGYKSLEDAIAEQLYTLELLPQILCIYFCPDLEGKYCWLVSKTIDDARPILRYCASISVPTWKENTAGLSRKQLMMLDRFILHGRQNGQELFYCRSQG